MADRSIALPTLSRQLLKLASEDRAAASRLLAGLSVEEQVAAVCEAPLGMRARLLELCPSPEAVVPLVPEAELCFTCKHVGVEDASWLLALATDTQIVACFDLDAWRGLVPDPRRLDAWLASLAEAGDETLLRAARALDPEMLALYLREHIGVELKPSGNDDWQPPIDGQTLDGQFWYVARESNDDMAPLLHLLRVLFEQDYWLYFRMLQSVSEEIGSEIEEWALRWRTGRLEDLGFPPWERAMRIYGHLRRDQLAEVPIEPRDLDVDRWQLPVWISGLPAAADSRHSVFRAIAQLDTAERSRFFYAFLSLANKVAVADRRDLGDAATLPGAIEKAARVSSLGLEHVASANGLELVDALRRVPLERLFRVGVQRSPNDERPLGRDVAFDDGEQGSAEDGA